MAGALLYHPQSLDYCAMPCQRKQDFSNISPISLYSPLADFSTDTSPSPESSPISPVFTNSYALPTTTDDWLPWDDKTCANSGGFPPKDEPFDDDDLTNLAAIPPRNASASPGVDPMQLCSNPAVVSEAFADDNVPYGCDALGDTPRLIQQQQQQPPSISTATTEEAPRRMLSYGLTSSPAAAASSARYPSRKYKSRSSPSAGAPLSRHSSPSPPPPPPSRATVRRAHVAAAGAPRKTAHNMIEKRYRTNLNDKIKALRDAVPALRVMARKGLETSTSVAGVGRQRGGRSEEAEMAEFGSGFAGARIDEPGAAAEDDEDDEDLGGLVPVHKLNKATILSKATEYICLLERRNQHLAKENAILRGKVESLETFVMSRAGGATGGMWGGGPYGGGGAAGNLQMLPTHASLIN